MNRLRCGKCGAFVSLKHRVFEGASTGFFIWCSKCKALLSVCLYDC